VEETGSKLRHITELLFCLLSHFSSVIFPTLPYPPLNLIQFCVLKLATPFPMHNPHITSDWFLVPKAVSYIQSPQNMQLYSRSYNFALIKIFVKIFDRYVFSSQLLLLSSKPLYQAFRIEDYILCNRTVNTSVNFPMFLDPMAKANSHFFPRKLLWRLRVNEVA